MSVFTGRASKYTSRRKMWVGNHLFGAKSGNHCFVECGNRVFKHPLCWIRPPFRMDEVTVPRESGSEGAEEITDQPSSSDQKEMLRSASPQFYGETIDEQVELAGEIVDTDEKRRNPEYRVEMEGDVFQVGEISPCGSPKNQEQEKYASVAESDEDAIIGNADSSRSPPRIYITIEGCVQAIVKEMTGLTRADQRGISSLLAVPVNHRRYANLPIVHSVLIVKKKNHTTYKARLCVRGDELRGKTDFDTTPPTAARVSTKILLVVAAVFQWAVKSVDISQAFLQSEMMAPHQRVGIFPPKCTPCPWLGKVNQEEKSRSEGKWCFVTIRPLYGTTCAPLRWFSRLATLLLKRHFTQTRTDPCVFRLEVENNSIAVCIVHVGDILVTGSPLGHAKFAAEIGCFVHSGIEEITESTPTTYLGLGIAKRGKSFQVHQEEYPNTRVRATLLEDVVRGGTFIVNREKRETLMRQTIGSLLWLNMTRMDCSHEVAWLASSTTMVLDDVQLFEKWVTRGNKLIIFAHQNFRYINYASPLNWIPKSPTEALSALHLYCFTDASHASLPKEASVHSYTLLIGRIMSRNGDFLANGNVIDDGSKKIHRVCKSSLSAEVVSLGTALDLTLRTKVLVVEFPTGRFIREILDSADNYALQTPFDPAPSTIAVKQEISDMSQSVDNLFDGRDAPALQEQLEEAVARGIQEAEKKFADAFNESRVEMLKTFVFTDASNAYSSIISGFPSTTERFLRTNSPYIRDLAPLIALTYIDKDYNLSDSGSKSNNGQYSLSLLLLAMQYNTFKFGFIGRKKIRGLTDHFVSMGKLHLKAEQKAMKQ